MKRGNHSTKALLVIHFIFLALWLGGVASCLPLLLRMDITNLEETQSTYIHIRNIAHNVIGWGGIGTFFTGICLAIFTNWGLFKHKWVMAKFFLVIFLILFGMFFNEHRILSNLELMENKASDALNTTEFLTNHAALKTGMIIGTIGYIIVITIAVFKPWMKKEKPKSKAKEILYLKG